MAFVAVALASFDLASTWRKRRGVNRRAAGALLIAGLALAPFAAFAALDASNPATDTALGEGRRFAATAPDVYRAVRRVIEDCGWQIEDVEAGGAVVPAAGGRVIPDAIAGESPDAEDDIAIGGDLFPRPNAERYEIGLIARDAILSLPSRMTISIVEAENATMVGTRSTSLMVARDLGQNRRFIDAFLRRLDAAMAAASSPAP